MNIINHTPFPALSFEGVDQDNTPFHVVVLRQTLTFAGHTLAYSNVQEPLSEADTDLLDGTGTRQESDLCQFKPRCDVILNGTAYAPKSLPSKQFLVRLRISKPGKTLDKSDRSANENASGSAIGQRRILVDKQLSISGPRYFKKKQLFIRAMQSMVMLASCGLLRPNPWRITDAKPVTAVPLDYTHAFGGQCRLNEGEPAAKRLGAKHRMTAKEVSGHIDGSGPPSIRPVFHTACQCNPSGTGFTDLRYLNATRIDTISAPQIENPDARVTPSVFWRALTDKKRGRLSRDPVALEATGYSVRPKSHPSRVELVGTIDDAFLEGGCPLPKNFDFSFWNAVADDQQVPYLLNDETIELTNLCPLETPGLSFRSSGDGVLSIELLRHECFILCRQVNGMMFERPLCIDTIIIEPNSSNLTLVWRCTLSKSSDQAIRTCEVRMRDHQERDSQERNRTALRDLESHVVSATKGLS